MPQQTSDAPSRVRSEQRQLVWRFVVGLAALPLAFTFIFIAVLTAKSDLDTAELRADEEARVAVTAFGLDFRVDIVASDARVATSSREVTALASDRGDGALDAASSVFRSFVINKPAVLQVRYVDELGAEHLAVRRSADEVERVGADELADWSGRSQLAELRDIRAGEVYVTRFETAETAAANGTGHSPIVSAISPLADDSSGTGAGFVVIDFDGERLLEAFRTLMGADDTDAMLLDANGRWLVAPDLQDRGTRGDSFAQRYPDAWDAIENVNKGVVRTGDGLYTFATAYPDHAELRFEGERFIAERAVEDRAVEDTESDHDIEGHAHPNAWKVVSFVPAEDVPAALVTRDAATFWTYVAGVLVVSGVAAYLTMVAMGRRRLRRSIKETATRLAAIRDTLSDGLIVIDSAGRISDVNPECERLLGWSREEMLGQDGHKRFHNHPDHPCAADECPLRAAATTGATFRSEDEVFERRDGTAMHVGVSAAPLVVDGEHAGAVIVFRDITEIRSYQEEIRWLAFRDELTGLPNRRVFSDRLEQAIATADRRSTALAVMFLDLDGFKDVNDDYGHDVGDDFLRVISARIRDSVRTSDTLARYGGDEFVVLLPEIEGREEAEVVARRIIASLARPVDVDGYLLHAGVSIGVATRMDGEDAETVVAKADAAMYAAKQAGRNHYSVSGRAPVAPPTVLDF